MKSCFSQIFCPTTNLPLDFTKFTKQCHRIGPGRVPVRLDALPRSPASRSLLALAATHVLLLARRTGPPPPQRSSTRRLDRSSAVSCTFRVSRKKYPSCPSLYSHPPCPPLKLNQISPPVTGRATPQFSPLRERRCKLGEAAVKK